MSAADTCGGRRCAHTVRAFHSARGAAAFFLLLALIHAGSSVIGAFLGDGANRRSMYASLETSSSKSAAAATESTGTEALLLVTAAGDGAAAGGTGPPESRGVNGSTTCIASLESARRDGGSSTVTVTAAVVVAVDGGGAGAGGSTTSTGTGLGSRRSGSNGTGAGSGTVGATAAAGGGGDTAAEAAGVDTAVSDATEAVGAAYAISVWWVTDVGLCQGDASAATCTVGRARVGDGDLDLELLRTGEGDRDRRASFSCRSNARRSSAAAVGPAGGLHGRGSVVGGVLVRGPGDVSRVVDDTGEPAR